MPLTLRKLLLLSPAVFAAHALMDDAAALAAPETRFGKMTFDPASEVIELPWTGARPDLKVIVERSTRVCYVDMPGRLPGRPQARNPESTLRRVLYAQYRPGVVRLAVRGDRPVRLVPTLKGMSRKGSLVFRVVPLERTRASRPSRSPHRLQAGTNVVHPFRLQSPNGPIVLPIEGPKPVWRLHHDVNLTEFVEVSGRQGGSAVLKGKTQSALLKDGPYERIVLAQNRLKVVRLAVRGRDEPPHLRAVLVRIGRSYELVFGSMEGFRRVTPAPSPQPTALPLATPSAVPAATPSAVPTR